MWAGFVLLPLVRSRSTVPARPLPRVRSRASPDAWRNKSCVSCFVFTLRPSGA
jgi:hypothetical protein